LILLVFFVKYENVKQGGFVHNFLINIYLQVHELIPESYQIPADWDKWKLAESTEERNHPQELPGRNIKADNDNWCL